MKTPARKTFSRILLTATLCLAVAAPVLAQSSEPSAEAGDPVVERGGSEGRGGRGHHGRRHDGQRPGEPESVRLHMELGRYYLLAEQYAEARDHFLAVAQMELPAGAEADAERDEEAVAAFEDTGRGERGGRRGHGGGHAVRGRTRAYVMAAVSSELLGDHEGAIALAEEGQALRPERPEGDDDASSDERRGRDRRDPLADFLADPAAFAADYAGGAATLEARLLEIESSVDENVAQ